MHTHDDPTRLDLLGALTRQRETLDRCGIQLHRAVAATEHQPGPLTAIAREAMDAVLDARNASAMPGDRAARSHANDRLQDAANRLHRAATEAQHGRALRLAEVCRTAMHAASAGAGILADADPEDPAPLGDVRNAPPWL